MELLQITTSVAQGMMAMPFIKWNEILSTVGDSLNIPNLADMIDQQGMQQAMQQQAQAAASAQAPQGVQGQQQPRNAMGEPSPIPASSLSSIRGAANRT
jgi:hypothetical protein